MKTSIRRALLASVVTAVVGALTVTSCSSDDTSATGSEPGPSTATTGAGGSGGVSVTDATGAGAGMSFATSGQGGAVTGAGGSCADAVVQADVKLKPADIIFVVDVSGSMSDEIAAIEKNINVNFAQIIAQSGVDYRIIMLVDHGPGTYELCVEAPLSTIPKGGCSKIGAGPPGNNPGKFYQYSMKGYPQSNDSLCLVLDSLYGTEKDDFGLAPNGWVEWLRPEAEKIFLFITDDRPDCTWNGGPNGPITFDDNNTAAGGKQMALDFDKALLGLAPQQFGTAAERHYQFYGLIGLETKNLAKNADTQAPIAPNASPLDPFKPTDPATKDTCDTAVAPATGYQYLAKGTGGLRFPVCELTGYDVIFKKIAEGVVSGTKVPCEIELPKPNNNQELDLKTVSLLYTPMGMGGPEEFVQVDAQAACADAKNKFYIDKDKGKIQLCPDTCKVIEADSSAKVQVKIECGGSAF